MTRAPENLLALRSLLLAHLNVSPSVRGADLEPAEVGIVGDSAHRGGYHCGSDRVVSNDYSVVESPRDRTGLTLDASALDVGLFEYGEHNLRTFSAWCVAQCMKNTPDTRDIREIIYSPDGRTVRRWDRLGRRSSGDSSHLWHTHFSFHRDAIKAGRDLTPLFRRYLETIGLLEDDVTITPEDAQTVARAVVGQLLGSSGPTVGVALQATYAKVGALAERDFTNEPEIIAGVLRGMTPELIGSALKLAGMTPESIAAMIPADLAADVVDELSRRTAPAGQ